MAKIAFLAPEPDLCKLAQSALERWPEMTVICVEYVPSDRIRLRALDLEVQGCDLIIARGVHAKIARQSVRIPVIEMRVTTQELGVLIMSLKKELDTHYPRLGLIGFSNMFGDTSQLSALFQIDLRLYMAADSDELASAVDQAVRDGCQAVIGGDIVCRKAESQGLSSRFLPGGEESVRTALETASRVCYAIDLEKSNSAEIDTVLDNTFSAMVQVEQSGIVRRVNRAGCQLFGKRPDEVAGQTITTLLPALDLDSLRKALAGEHESYNTVMEIRQAAVLVNVVPIQVDGSIRGALFTFQEAARIAEMDSKLRLELYRRGYIANHTFDRYTSESKVMKTRIATAKRVAKYSAPVLLMGEPGTGKGILAQCVHNESLYRKHAFVPLDCGAWQADTVDAMLFGNYSTRRDGPDCMAEQARDGTLYLSHVDALPMETQYKLTQLTRGSFLHNGPNQPEQTNVRVIASTDVNLAALVDRGEFRRDLYYALNVLSLELLPMRERKEDIIAWFDLYLNEWQERYRRYVHLTQGAYQFLQEYNWPGNLDEMNNLSERVVLLTEKRSVDEGFLKRQLELATPQMVPGTETVVVYKDKKAAELSQLLQKYHGNREKVASELGISKTTLWRRIKKYGIQDDYSF